MKKSSFSFLSTNSILLTLLFVVTLGMVPLFSQFVVVSKIFMTFCLTFVIILSYLISVWKKQSFALLKTPIAPAAGLFGLIALASSFSNEAYPFSNFLSMGGVLLSFSILILLGSTLIKKTENAANLIIKSFYIISISLITVTLLQKFGFGPSLLINKFLNNSSPNDISFNLVGSIFIALQITLLGIVGSLSKIIISKKAKLWELVSLAIMTASTFFYGWTILPGKVAFPIILSPAASWSIMLSAFGNLKTVLVGVGPNNYSNVFNQFKPAWLNNTQFSNIQFTQAANFPMTIVVTLGVIGLFAWLWLVFSLIKESKKIKRSTRPIHNMLLISFLFAIILPINAIILIIQAILLVFWIANEKERFASYKFGLHLGTKFAKLPKIANRIMVLIAALLVCAVFALFGRAVYAEFLMFQSSRVILNNDYIKAYLLQQKSIELNPYSDFNRKQYGFVNVTIAAALSQKADLTEEEKQQFTQLIQQAIREGKAAVLLDGMDTNNWRVLAQIYQSLIGVADRADEWAINSYIEAIKLAPTDPDLRVKLGGIFYARGEYQEALNFFNQAAELKPNFANSYYNIANTLIKMGRYEEAKVAYQKTLLLISPDSDDYLKASEELQILDEAIKQNLGKENLDQLDQQLDQQQADEAPLTEDPIVNPVEEQQVEAPPQPAQ